MRNYSRKLVTLAIAGALGSFNCVAAEKPSGVYEGDLWSLQGVDPANTERDMRKRKKFDASDHIHNVDSIFKDHHKDYWPFESYGLSTLTAQIYAGENNERNGGFEVTAPLVDNTYVGAFFRSSKNAVAAAGGDWYSAVGLQTGVTDIDSYSVGVFTFMYFTQNTYKTYAVGGEIGKKFVDRYNVRVSAKFRPVYAAITGKNSGGTAVVRTQAMFFGIVNYELKNFSLAGFGSGSYYPNSPDNLNTVVSMGDMTGVEVYDNNYAFSVGSLGAEAAVRATKWVGASAAYARIWLKPQITGKNKTDSILVKGTLYAFEGNEFFGGYQWINGGPADNRLGLGGVSLNF